MPRPPCGGRAVAPLPESGPWGPRRRLLLSLTVRLALRAGARLGGGARVVCGGCAPAEPAPCGWCAPSGWGVCHAPPALAGAVSPLSPRPAVTFGASVRPSPRLALRGRDFPVPQSGFAALRPRPRGAGPDRPASFPAARVLRGRRRCPRPLVLR
ncbi:hypothetical protein SMALA_4249 [Streptomyces malaysiensis subsp. malaysiensis]|nr:hypothetical protein SMALA_4249 [Streptomyces malaysiensis]